MHVHCGLSIRRIHPAPAAGLVMCCYISGAHLRPEQTVEMIRYLRSHQNGDGGWGLYASICQCRDMKFGWAHSSCRHIAATSGIFGTGLNYVALRLLGAYLSVTSLHHFSHLRHTYCTGVPASDPDCQRARRFLLAHGGCTWIAQWGKVWLACLGVYSWEGVNAIPPELWDLPYWLPCHPARWWCHCRCALALSPAA